MIVDLPRFTLDEYNNYLSNYYSKPGIPEIEIELQEHQKKILIDGDYSQFGEFKSKLQIYTRSLILKHVLGEKFIDEGQVDMLSEKATDIFIKRYFRMNNPIVGASFAGLLDYKAREVLIDYWKKQGIESTTSLDAFDETTTNLENKIFFNDYKHQMQEDFSPEEEFEFFEEKLDKELNYLEKVDKKYKTLFLEYLNFFVILKSQNVNRKLITITNIINNFLNLTKEEINIMECGILDLNF